MQQLLFFSKLLKLVTLALLFSLPACLADKSAASKKLKVNDAAEISTKPEILWITTAEGRGEESHGHFLLSCSDGGFLQLVKLEACHRMHKFFRQSKSNLNNCVERRILISWSQSGQWRNGGG